MSRLLIHWNSAMNTGRGRSGTRYSIERGLLTPSDPEPCWVVRVDDQPFSSASTERDAIIHSERVEALRCFLNGLTAEMTEGQLDSARSVVAEMSQAADRSISEPGLAPRELQDLQESRMALRALYAQILFEQQRRDPSSPPPSVH